MAVIGPQIRLRDRSLYSIPRMASTVVKCKMKMWKVLSCRRCRRRLHAVQSLWRQLIGLWLNVAWPVCANNVNVPTATTPVDVIVTIMSAGNVITVATNDHQMRQILALHILLTILHQLCTFRIFIPHFRILPMASCRSPTTIVQWSARGLPSRDRGVWG